SLASRVRGRQPKASFQFPYPLGALKSFCEDVNSSCIQIVDAIAKSLQFWLSFHHLGSGDLHVAVSG
ncbi:hypothetical protein, partial [Acinetobacter baumannii]|uniref:hypothetical protein n=1 Tax=Acinetobacter baumannii TaxID=470 RepID=UPI001BB46333